MKNKGFTLIELLAVIVILALIALVTIPMINNVIEKAKKGALEDSVYGLKSAAELYYSTTGTSETIEFDCTEEGCISGDKKLPFKGTVNEGKVKLFSDGKVSICIENDKFASSILAEEKKTTTSLGSCDYTKEEYAITELVSANEYKKVKADLDLIKESLYNKTLISSTSNSAESIANDIDNLDLNATSYEIYEDGTRVSGYPDGSYNVGIECEGATGTWNNTFKGVILSNVNNENVKCKINFVTCTTGNCDTNTIAWVNWVTLLGYNPNDYNDLNDFLSKEMVISACADIDKLYNNDNGAYDYLKTQTSLIKEINETVNFSACSSAFNYTGNVQNYLILQSGIYKLEVYGAQGGFYNGTYPGGNGGYSVGYKKMSKGETVYIVVGGAGKAPASTTQTTCEIAGGYNGGAKALFEKDYSHEKSGSGGGATHIATSSGLLSSLSGNKTKILLVAGGGGGAFYNANTTDYSRTGGTGGGNNGGNGAKANSSWTAGIGGTQTGGAAFGAGGSQYTGGGGGYYGGTGGKTGSAGGGSGYTDGVKTFVSNGITYSPSSQNGKRSGNGYAKITFAGIN